MLTIMLADDHNAVRKGIRALLALEPDFDIIGEASNGLETIELVQKLQPQILVLDLTMGGISGLEVSRRMNSISRGTSIVVLTMHNDQAYVQECLRCGVKAYVLKENSADELIRAIHEVAQGHVYLSSSLVDSSIDTSSPSVKTPTNNGLHLLTSREKEILQMAARGDSNGMIASYLGISTRTVETHRANVMRKLCLRNRTELFQFALMKGIVPRQPPSNQD
jgi:two-component system, NarL family, response regulator NreC